MRSVADVEIELAKLMGAPPLITEDRIMTWVGKIQSLIVELHRAKRIAARARVRKLKKEEKDAN